MMVQWTSTEKYLCVVLYRISLEDCSTLNTHPFRFGKLAVQLNPIHDEISLLLSILIFRLTEIANIPLYKKGYPWISSERKNRKILTILSPEQKPGV